MACYARHILSQRLDSVSTLLYTISCRHVSCYRLHKLCALCCTSHLCTCTVHNFWQRAGCGMNSVTKFFWSCWKSICRFISKLYTVVALKVSYYSNFFGSAGFTCIVKRHRKLTCRQRGPERLWHFLIFRVFWARTVLK